MTLRLRTAVSVLTPSAPAPASRLGAPDGGDDAVVEVGGTPDHEPDGQPAPTGHARLVDLLVDQVPEADTGPDLVLLAYARPEASGFKTVASYLNMRTGGDAHSLALCGQGLGAPFSAVRVAGAYERTGQSSKSLLAILDCAPADAADRPDASPADSGVLLTFDTGSGAGAVDTVVSVGSAELASRLAELVPEGGRLLVVLGPGGDPGAVPAQGADLHRASGEGHGTGVWSALVQHWTEWESAYPVVVLCDTDPGSDTSHLLVLRAAAE
ncbi:hypothetical protein [Kitasatospora sp. DSM 101779]|uniref:Uncharacterized protein n=1 Tax=Kitasatospora sp. 152608 TaxID=1769566 RepID=A0A0U2ZPF7_9ACTN|nr:hypothetical protein [Kitasatospora sp. DSM 101779]ALT05940.1 hypothetical protein KSSN_24470 [Kitasatospora sp. 152608]MCU7825072.1 hypothetical protein [Kitasatospora sp. DSM 101779]